MSLFKHWSCSVQTTIILMVFGERDRLNGISKREYKHTKGEMVFSENYCAEGCDFYILHPRISSQDWMATWLQF